MTYGHRADGYSWAEVQAGKPYRDAVNEPLIMSHDLSDFGDTPEEQRERLQACVDFNASWVACEIAYYDEMGWSHGVMPIDRPFRSERYRDAYQELLEQVQ